MEKFAFSITPEFVEVMAQMSGADTSVLGEQQLFALVETLSDTKFSMEFMTEDQLVEIVANDPEVTIAQI